MTISLPFGETVQVILDIGYAVDEFTLDDATYGQLDGAGKLDGTTEGADVSAYVQEIEIGRGRTDELGTFETGTASIVLLNNDRRFDPINTASPYYDPVDQRSGIQPRRAVTIKLDGVGAFKGRIVDIDLAYATGPSEQSVVKIEAADDFLLLASVVVEADTTPPQELSSARLTRILDLPEIAFPTGVAARNVETGSQTLGNYQIDGQTNALTYLQRIQEAEQGYLFIDGAGVLNFVARDFTTFLTGAVAFADDGTAINYSNVGVSYGQEFLYNKIIVQREGGTSQIVDDTDSQDTYGISTLSLTESLLSDDTAALNLANALLNNYALPQYRFDNLLIVMNELDATDRASVLGIELSDAITVKRTYDTGSPVTKTDGAGIQRITHRITPATHEVEFGLDTREIVYQFILAEPDVAEYRYNKVIYPSFESATLTGFSTPHTGARSTLYAYDGSYSYETTLSTTNSNVGGYATDILTVDTDAGPVTNAFTLDTSALDGANVLNGTLVTPTSWVLSAYFFIPSGSALVGRSIELGAENGSAVYTNSTSSTAALTQNTWVRASRLITFSNTPAQMPEFVARISGGSLGSVAGETVYSDGWLLEKTSTAKAWFDGNSTSVSGFTSVSCSWDGTADASTSTLNGLPDPYGDTTYSTLDGANALA